MEWIFRILYIYLFLGSAADCLRPGPGGPIPLPLESSGRGSTSSLASVTPPPAGGKRKSEAVPVLFQIVQAELPALRVKFRRLHPVVSPVSLPTLPLPDTSPGPHPWPPSATQGAPRSSSPPRPLPPAQARSPPPTCSGTARMTSPCSQTASPWTPRPMIPMGRFTKVSWCRIPD